MKHLLAQIIWYTLVSLSIRQVLSRKGWIRGVMWPTDVGIEKAESMRKGSLRFNRYRAKLCPKNPEKFGAYPHIVQLTRKNMAIDRQNQRNAFPFCFLISEDLCVCSSHFERHVDMAPANTIKQRAPFSLEAWTLPERRCLKAVTQKRDCIK